MVIIIFSFPTLHYFKDGVMQYKYEGELTEEAVFNFLKAPSKEKASPPQQYM